MSQTANTFFSSTDQLVSGALDRNTISKNYHYENYPYFLRAQQPVLIKDPKLAKGLKNCDAPPTYINGVALKRFHEEVGRIQQLREKQKYDFTRIQKETDTFNTGKAKLQRENQIFNSLYLIKQREENLKRRHDENINSKQFYKTHFGPEETDELVHFEQLRKQHQQQFISSQLKFQMEQKESKQKSNI